MSSPRTLQHCHRHISPTNNLASASYRAASCHSIPLRHCVASSGLCQSSVQHHARVLNGMATLANLRSAGSHGDLLACQCSALTTTATIDDEIQDAVAARLDYWLRLGDHVCANLGFGSRDQLTSVQRVSIDDFYLTFEGQQALAAANPANPLLLYRGNAGSHDVKLGTDTLRALTTTDGSATPCVPLPRYDKSANGGRGDRAPSETWPTATLPVDIVLFEGWMLGFRPQSDDAVAAIDPSLLPVNAALRAYKAAWDAYVDSWLVIQVDDPNFVYDWRLQAEVRMRAAGKPGMTDEQVKDFVDRYMPAYRAYLPSLYSQGPTTARAGHTLFVEVDEARAPLDVQPQRTLGAA